MDIMVLLALVIGALVCLLPGIMAWSYYYGGSKQAERKRRPITTAKPVTNSNTC